MDKKQNFSRQVPPSKGQVTSESRRSSDLCTSKPWPKNGRRRENPNQSNSKADAQRITKPTPPKSRPNFERRRQRGGSGTNPINLFASGSRLAAVDESAVGETASTDEIDIELNSVYSSGSKKQNLNHLLNFQYASRENDAALPAGGFPRTGNTRSYQRKPKYNKEQFLQANCQFVVKSSTDLQVNLASPDTLVEWAFIEQINVQTIEELQCPICLYPPVAAKLTRCGHAYCWPCILHYLALSDRPWRKCPICYEAIHLSDLKSTYIIQQSQYNVGEYVTLQMMCRKQGSYFFEEVGETQNDCYIPHVSDKVNQKRFSKFLLADPKEILSILERERLELETNDKDCPEFVFIQQALGYLQHRKNEVLKDCTVNDDDIAEGEEYPDNLNLSIACLKIQDEDCCEYFDSKDAQYFDSKDAQKNVEAIKDDKKTYFFYQSVDGQNIYLHALNVKMLQEMYGSLENSPKIIRAKILQKENHSMSDDFRKRYKYLQHLPLTCQFEIVEIQLEPPLISEDIFKKFKDEIVQRQKIRMRRAREEKKRERHINEINDRKMGKLIARSANIDIQSNQQFPSCGFEDFPSGGSFSDISDSPPQSSSSVAPTTVGNNNYPSFATMLSTTPKKEFWPSLGNFNSIGNGDFSTNAWGTTANPHVTIRSEQQINDSNGDIASIATHSFGDAIADALEQKKLQTNKKITSAKNDGDTSAITKKNKKAKKMLLFSTGINFNGN